MRPIRKFISPESLIIMGVPKHFCNTTLEDFIEYPDVKALKNFIYNYIIHLENNLAQNRGIFLCGSNGVGKSMLSCIILKEAYKLRYTCRRLTFSQYISYYTELWGNKDNTSEFDFIANYKGVEFLVLEEVGKEIDSKIAKPILEDLLRYREEKGFTTIICSNITFDDFRNNYGNSICSLVNGNMDIISINAKDRRC